MNGCCFNFWSVSSRTIPFVSHFNDVTFWNWVVKFRSASGKSVAQLAPRPRPGVAADYLIRTKVKDGCLNLISSGFLIATGIEYPGTACPVCCALDKNEQAIRDNNRSQMMIRVFIFTE